jgi:hypothetical protein
MFIFLRYKSMAVKLLGNKISEINHLPPVFYGKRPAVVNKIYISDYNN